MHGVLGYEKGHTFWPLRSHRHLLSLLASRQEVSHLQRTGPVQNQGIETFLTSFFCPCMCSLCAIVKMFFFFFTHRLRSVWFALIKRQRCSSSPAVTCALVRVGHLSLSPPTLQPLLSSPRVICLSSSQKSSFGHLTCQNVTSHITWLWYRQRRAH